MCKQSSTPFREKEALVSSPKPVREDVEESGVLHWREFGKDVVVDWSNI
jgi:hypothetical protein